METIQYFFSGCSLLLQWKATFITFILKVDNPNLPKDFPPINLCNFLYKLITKILVGRLKKFLPNIVVSEEHGPL